MTQVEILDAVRDGAGGYKVDVSRGVRIGRVSSEWFSRPDDERYLSLSDLSAAISGRRRRCAATISPPPGGRGTIGRWAMSACARPIDVCAAAGQCERPRRQMGRRGDGRT
jgi:hypothetical protein